MSNRNEANITFSVNGAIFTATAAGDIVGTSTYDKVSDSDSYFGANGIFEWGKEYGSKEVIPNPPSTNYVYPPWDSIYQPNGYTSIERDLNYGIDVAFLYYDIWQQPQLGFKITLKLKQWTVVSTLDLFGTAQWTHTRTDLPDIEHTFELTGEWHPTPMRKADKKYQEHPNEPIYWTYPLKKLELYQKMPLFKRGDWVVFNENYSYITDYQMWYYAPLYPYTSSSGTGIGDGTGINRFIKQ